ncbi:MAG TPA: efflux RND transporter periplasmic adaptor subunit [Verrucomicrobiae bacterium]|nr:efflux RND transporter periplasmic adaptor subunit [Verrucomicrobiae bacterium]
MTRNERVAVIAAGGLLLAGALGLGYLWGNAGDAGPAPATSATSAEKKVLYWYDPMVPNQHFDKPGKSPFMDMQLVPKYADDAPGSAGVRIAPEVRQNLGIRTVVATRGRLPATQRVPGTIGWNLREERVISLPVDAVVERLFVRTPFEPVRSGQVLMAVRSPTWSAALAEAGALRNAQSVEGRSLQAATGGRLRALGLPAGAKVDARGAIVLTAPAAGVVSEIVVREGQAVAAGMPLLRLNGTGSVWVEAALPPLAASSAGTGTPVDVSVDALPGETFTGTIEALLPQVDAGTRTQRARIVLDNPEGRLVPGQFVQVALRPAASGDAVLVPSGAIIDDGTQPRVIVLANDRFVLTIVRTGRSGGGMTEIVSGLSGGEQVVASGQFLIDSEANLSGALERLGAKDDTP